MEYIKKKEEILASVEYHNLLSFNLVQNKLERNFKAIVDALLLNQDNYSKLKEQFDIMNHQHSQELAILKNQINLINNSFQTQPNKSNLQNHTQHKLLSQKNPSRVSIKTNKINHQDYQNKNNQQNNINKSNQQYHQQIQNIKSDLLKLKNNTINLDYQQKIINQIQKDISTIKGQLYTINQKSYKNSLKSIKKQSIRELGDQNKFININDNQKRNSFNKDIFIKIQDQNQNIINKQQLQKQFNNICIQINTFKLSLDQLKDICSDLKKKQNRHTMFINDLNEQIKKLDKQSITNNQIFDKQLKNIQLQLLNNQNNNIQLTQSKQNNSNNNKQISINYKNQINDKLSKLQTMIQNVVTNTQFQRFKQQIRSKIDNLQNSNQQIKDNFDEEMKKLYQFIDSKNTQISDLKKQIANIKQLGQQKTLQFDRKHNISLSKIQEVKKNLQNLREDVQFYQSMQTQNNNQGPAKTQASGQDSKDKNKEGNNIDSKQLENLKKSLNGKIQDQRLYLLGLIRDLQRKLTPKGSLEQQVANILDKISQINLYLSKKADQQDTKKNQAYLQKKLNLMANHLLKNQQGNQDARIAKTNWFCLSCDKNLQNYNGKVGKHVVWDYMPLKSGNKFIKEQKKNLPLIKR